ncbi:MAG: hypothetical protein IKA30_01495 [Alphaproteobacteria bacterium]|nr:hypothetical protein [Alphaproteobacteria bacterium]
MREVILKAVASPPKILWGPFLPVLVNLGVQFPLMFMFMGVAGANPLWFMVSLLAGHVAAVIVGGKEPHISSMIQAYGPTSKKTVNLYSEKGNKFAP